MTRLYMLASLIKTAPKFNYTKENTMKHKLLKLKLWFKGFKRLWTITSIEHRLDLYEVRISGLKKELTGGTK